MSTDATERTAEWFFDFVSPFAYLQLEQFEKLPASLTVEPTPIVLGAVLAHWGQRGPAEIAAKRSPTASASSHAIVVFPVPGGPHRISEERRPAATIRPIAPSGPVR